ncbi:MAG TPA: NAD(P)-dependent oxidoreductase [Phenylobacterium sp.]|jgi:3-hydroxyisobutyrate dehydrogenase-like beta-hydroxyacid dehydrogenase|uniref:NAD(P)-dependent oxidoreductase n=1 Tax=Phenylobacterium sp. TaxID=1871053 RepID=UPI002BAACE7E|nr:NAD(P)-dependent oxidoreductase [Phenylobacterium sp.]HXA38687.1 NAD(P)-dependent oxidoreductase [Phenylobacterium sp.]
MTTPPPDKPPVAFLGLGKMGVAMATNLRRAGYPLVVWNRSAGKAESLRAAGATLAQSPAAAAQAADIVISSLADDASLRAVVSGPDGVLSGLRPGAIHIGASTVSPGLSDELGALHAAAGGRYIAGPVVGRVPAAEAARLVTFVAGDSDAIEAVRAVISAYAPMIAVVGERQGQAAVAKLIANFLGASGMDLIGQSLAWAEKSGLPPDLVPQMLSGFFGNPGTREYITKIGERDFDDVGFTAAGGLKDVQLMIDAAQAVDLRLSSAEALRAKLDAAIARGWQNRDWSCFTDIDRAPWRTP